jgi:signal transduction histidine kinase
MGSERIASILVVDDDDDLHALVKTVLEAHDFQVRGAKSAAAALDAIEAAAPALVLLDVRIPDMGGVELARRLRAKKGFQQLPIVFMTSPTDAGTGEQAAEVGGNDFLIKPFSSWELLSRVRALISVTELHMEVERCYRDMTRQMRALSKAREHQKTLTELVAHDMKNPVTAIVIGVEHALSAIDTTPERAKESLLAAKSGAVALQCMLSDMLDVEVAEERGLVPAKIPVNVGRIVGETVRQFEPRAEDIGLMLEARVDGDLGRPMLDKSLLSRMLANLVDNALRYAPRGTAVRLHARAEEGTLLIDVVDQGPGVPEEKREMIFEKYSRGSGADPGRTQRGLGLSFCRLAARAHGGEVVIKAGPGGGTCFRVSLPISET